MDQNKVFLCIPCLMLGGSEVAALQMARALKEGGYTVTAVCYYESDLVMTERWKHCGIRLIFLNEKRNGISGLFHLLKVLTDLFRKESPDVVHVQYFAPGMIPILAAKLAGIHHIFATVHAAGNRGYSWKAKLMFRISAAMTTHFFCVAENTERFWFGSVGGRRHSTIHNGVDVPLFERAEAVRIPGITEKNTVIGIAGRIVKLKGHDCLFRAVKRLLPEIPDLKLLIVGDGSDRPYFENMAEDMGLKERIVWTGRVEPEDLPGYYKAMDVLAMPSHWEGFGLTAAEAMAAGVPVAASDVPGLREVVGDAGVLFPVDDDYVLAHGIKQILTDRQFYSAAGWKYVSEHFSLRLQQLKWQKAYQKEFAGDRY